jgi:phosphatidylglycerophosphatase C
MNSKKLLLLDFDGTITTKDTFPLFIKFDKGFVVFVSIFFLFSPFLFLYKLKLIEGGKIKLKMLSLLYKNVHQDLLIEKGIAFVNFLESEDFIKPSFIKIIEKGKADKTEICIVSASPDIWISVFAKKHAINYICTQLSFSNNLLFDGKFETLNCVAIEKVNRIKQQYKLTDFVEIIAYGNSQDDEEMYKIATSFYRV